MEKTSSFSEGLAKAAWHIARIKNELDVICEWMDAGLIKNAYLAAFELAYETEQLTLLTRILPAYTDQPLTLPKAEQMLACAVPARIGFTKEGWFCVSIPALLPKKTKGNADYIRSITYAVMRQFFKEKQPVYYPDCVLVFQHIYNRDRPERLHRDHDNIELKTVIDVIALYILKDDAALRCFHYYCSMQGDEDRTDVFVVPQTEFPAWLKTKEYHAETEVELYDNIPFSSKKQG